MKNVSIGIVLIFISLPLFAENHLKLYLFPGPKPYNWKSPKTVTRSALLNTIAPTRFKYRHALGHVSVELKCEGLDGGVFNDFTNLICSNLQDKRN